MILRIDKQFMKGYITLTIFDLVQVYYKFEKLIQLNFN